MKRLFAIAFAAACLLGCSSTYSHLEVVLGEDNATVFDPNQRLEIGVGWSARLRAVDTGNDPHTFDLRSRDESKLVVAHVVPTERTKNDPDHELGVVFAFLPRKVGPAEVDVIVDGELAERITMNVSPQ